ncbi:MAG: ABC transporter ATP-binding protein [Coriobacteriia bacterium]|nr:ABC transporter ATP-binding protein [Coriobacteriia bacterium]
MALLELEHAAFSYDGHCAVSGLSFLLEDADYLCVVGENGSGKSTLVKGMLGQLEPSAGAIRRSALLKRGSIGYLPQQHALQKNFPASVEEVVLSGRLAKKKLFSFYTSADRRAALNALATLGAAELLKARYGELSGGQQQRVLLARALAVGHEDLKLLILDEPMNGLDPLIKRELYDLIETLNREQQIAIVMVSHDVKAAVNFAKNILYLDSRQEYYGNAHAFSHTAVGQELIRDSCSDNCAICGLHRETE